MRKSVFLVLALCFVFGVGVQAADPGVAGLACWWRADTNVVLSGGQVYTWTDSVSGTVLYGFTWGDEGPTVEAGGLNGHDVLIFDGVNDKMQTYSAWGTPALPAMNEATYFFVTKNWSTGPLSWAYVANVDSVYCAMDTSGKLYAAVLNAWPYATAYATHVRPDSSQSVIMEYGFGAVPTDISVFLNGNNAILTGPTSGGATPLGNLSREMYLGHDYWHSTSRYFKGGIAEVLIYNRVLSFEERIAVGLYLGEKYAIDYVPEPGCSLVIASGLLALVGGAFRRRK